MAHKGYQLNKLHRSTNHSLVAGVMGGIAEYYGWSPTTFRLIVLIVTALTVVTLPMVMFAYIVLWILMPKATDASYSNKATSS